MEYINRIQKINAQCLIHSQEGRIASNSQLFAVPCTAFIKTRPKAHDDITMIARLNKIRPAKEAHTVGMALPEGYSWDDISYVIGGRRWKIRYINTEGYIVTMTGENRDVPGKNQYNMSAGGWIDYHPGETKHYDCGPCHTTGYSEAGNQDGLEGVVGTWAFPGITCEECHDPGKAHVDADGEGNILKDTSSAGRET